MKSQEKVFEDIIFRRKNCASVSNILIHKAIFIDNFTPFVIAVDVACLT